MRTKNGKMVKDRERSHLEDHPVDEAILAEAISQIDTQRWKFLVEQVDFPRPVGVSLCVGTGTDEEEGARIYYKTRPQRFGPTRFIRGVEPPPCSSVVVILKAADCRHPSWQGEDYILITAFVGEKSHPEPWDRNATPEAIEWWRTHAMIEAHDE